MRVTSAALSVENKSNVLWIHILSQIYTNGALGLRDPSVDAVMRYTRAKERSVARCGVSFIWTYTKLPRRIPLVSKGHVTSSDANQIKHNSGGCVSVPVADWLYPCWLHDQPSTSPVRWYCAAYTNKTRTGLPHYTPLTLSNFIRHPKPLHIGVNGYLSQYTCLSNTGSL